MSNQFWHSVPRWLVMRVAGLVRRFQSGQALRQTQRNAPELLVAYDTFSQGAQSGATRQPFKGWDLSKLLEAEKPQFIVELGSGTTSAVFARYALTKRIKYVSFEHSEYWAGVTHDCLSSAGLVGEGIEILHRASRVNELECTSGFVEEIPLEADFVYVDGPPCPIRGGVKWANDDVCRLLASRARPRTIVIDGRVETVRKILSADAGAEYDFEPSFVYALRAGKLIDALAMREHSVFRLRGMRS